MSLVFLDIILAATANGLEGLVVFLRDGEV